MENCLERMERIGGKQKIEDFKALQQRDYDFKVRHAEEKVLQFIEQCRERGLNCHVSVGGLDSITLLLFIRSLGLDVPAISVSQLEDASIQAVHRQLGGGREAKTSQEA